jgi:hypothetical protein
MTNLSKTSVHTLVDLVENKLGCMEVLDREDMRELTTLKRALMELTTLYGVGASTDANFRMPVEMIPRRGRKPKHLQD